MSPELYDGIVIAILVVVVLAILAVAVQVLWSWWT